MSNPNFLLYPQKRCSEEARVGMPMVAYFIAKDLVALYEAGTTIIITTSITITMTVCHGLFETLISYWDVYYWDAEGVYSMVWYGVVWYGIV